MQEPVLLSNKQLKKFAKSSEQGCPFCGADQEKVKVCSPANQDGVVIQTADCMKCKTTWTECFYRGDITEVQLG